MGNIKIMTENYIDLSIVSNATVSSEQAAFPISNIYNRQRRSKVWRSNGCYEITSLNNKIIFSEGSGSELTATLTIGNYSSITALFAEIKAKLEALGAATYTLEQDSLTKKVKITVFGGPTANFYWSRDSITQALASLLGFDSSSDGIGYTQYVADELKIGSGEWIKWDFGISTNPKAFILIGPRNSPIQISPSAVIKLQGNETNVWTNPSYDKTLTYNDSVISIISDNGLHSEALRYWRLYIDDTKNPKGFVEIGSIFLGNYFTPTRGAVQFPFSGEYMDASQTIYSEGGQTFSDIRDKSERFNLQFFGLTISEKESIDSVFDTYGTSSPLFVSLDPLSVFSSNENYYTRYVKFEKEPSYQLESPGVFSCNMTLREEL